MTRTLATFARTTALAVCLLAVAAALPAQAQIDRSKKPAAGPAPKAAFPEYHETTLSNGMKVLIVTNSAQPLVTFRLMIKSGSAFERTSGIAEFVTDLLTKGTKTRSSLQFAQEADFLGISIGAGSSDDAMNVSGSGLKKHAAKVLELMTDALYNPTFPEDELDKLRKQQLSGLATVKKDPDAVSGRLQITVGFNRHPYANFATEQSVKSITRDDLVTFHKAHFLPNISSLAVVGDVTPDEILPLLRKHFEHWPRGTAPKADFPAPQSIDGRTVHMVDLGPTQTQTSISVMTGSIPRNHPDYTTLGIANSILGGGFSGRLFANLREKHGFTYGAYSTIDARREHGMWMATSDVRRVATDSAVAEILREMKQLQDTPVTAEELSMHQQYASGRYLLSLENPGTTASRLQDIDLYGLDKDYYKTYVSRVMRITPDDVQRVAKTYFTPDRVAIGAVGDGSVIKAGLEKFGTVTTYDTDMKVVKDEPAMKVDMDVESVIEKHLTAIGGKERLAAIQSRRSEYDVSMQFGPQAIKGTLMRIEKAPNKSYEKSIFSVDMGAGPQEFEQQEGIDGTAAWSVSPMTGKPTNYQGEELARKLEDAQFNDLLRRKELGFTATLTAKRMLDGKPVYVVTLARKYGTTTLYISADDYMLVGMDRLEQRDAASTMVSQRYSEFAAHDGIIMPSRISVDAGQAQMEMRLKSVTHNGPVDDTIFSRK